MPNFEYRCPDCGPFLDLQPLNNAAKSVKCACGKRAQRAKFTTCANTFVPRWMRAAGSKDSTEDMNEASKASMNSDKGRKRREQDERIAAREERVDSSRQTLKTKVNRLGKAYQERVKCSSTPKKKSSKG